MENLWFEDELIPYNVIDDEFTRGTTKNTTDVLGVKAIVRIMEPSYQQIPAPQNTNGTKFWLVRLRVEFETINPRTEFLFANCQAVLEKLYQNEKDNPQVIEIYPEQIIDQEPKNIKVKIEPSLKFGLAQLSAEASLGEISKEIVFGKISSETKGYIGNEQRNPHWKLNPGKYPLEGIRDFFMIIRQPPTCSKFSLRLFVEAKIKNSKGVFLVKPKEDRLSVRRRRMIIE